MHCTVTESQPCPTAMQKGRRFRSFTCFSTANRRSSSTSEGVAPNRLSVDLQHEALSHKALSGVLCYRTQNPQHQSSVRKRAAEPKVLGLDKPLDSLHWHIRGDRHCAVALEVGVGLWPCGIPSAGYSADVR